MATYIPNATQTTEPVESRTVESAALEFRTLKGSINTRITVEEAARIAADSALQTTNNAQDVRLTAIENALLIISEGGLPGTVHVQRLSGTGAQTAFTLNVSVPTSALIDVFINGVYQNKNTFTISDTSLTFSEAPPAGTDNIEVVVSIPLTTVETDASLVSFRATDSTTVVRTAQDKLREVVSVKDFGGIGDGVTNDAPAALAMGAAVGFIRFTKGAYLCNTATFDYPVLFDPGAYVTVPSAEVLTITQNIESPRQWIFRGDGNYVLGHDGNSGENARQVHVSWFGAFPYPGVNPVDQAPFINKAFASMGNGRESIVDFDVGNYTMRSQVTVTRGGWVRGAGTRRTVFLHDSDGFDTFVTSNVACRFSEIQFEIRAGTISTRNNAFIRINHGDCEVYNVNAGQTKYGIVVNANSCRIDNMLAVYGSYPGADSSLVLIEGGSSNTVKNLLLDTSTFGPDALVHIGGPTQTGAISNTAVENINYVVPSIGVLVDARLGAISRGAIEKVRYNGFAGTPPSNFIKFITAGTFGLDDWVVNECYTNAYALNGIRLEQNSSGVMQDVLINNTTISGASGRGIEFVCTNGTLREITIGGAVDVSERAEPYYYSGDTQGFKISPTALPNVQPGYCYDFLLADDSVATVDLKKSMYTGFLMVSVGTTNYIIMVARGAPTPAGTTISSSANMATATTSLNGTTGADGKFTIGITDRVLYLENRLGASQRVTAVVMTGAA